VGRRSAAPRRAAGFALALMFSALLVRLLTLQLPPAHWNGELALGLGGAVYAAGMMWLPGHRGMWSDLAVIVRALVAAVIAGLIIMLASGYLDRLDVLAILLFAAVHLSAPAQARARALVAATERELALVDGAETLCCGIGPVEAAISTANALAERGPDAVLHVGIAGAPELEPETVVIGTEARYCDIADAASTLP